MSFSIGATLSNLGNDLATAGTNLISTAGNQAAQAAGTAIQQAAQSAVGAVVGSSEVGNTDAAMGARQTQNDPAAASPASPQDDSAATVVGFTPTGSIFSMNRLKEWMPWIIGGIAVLAGGIIVGKMLRKKAG